MYADMMSTHILTCAPMYVSNNDVYAVSLFSGCVCEVSAHWSTVRNVGKQKSTQHHSLSAEKVKFCLHACYVCCCCGCWLQG